MFDGFITWGTPSSVIQSFDGGVSWQQAPEWPFVPQWRTNQYAHGRSELSAPDNRLAVSVDGGRRVIVHRFPGQVSEVHWPRPDLGILTVVTHPLFSPPNQGGLPPVTVYLSVNAGMTWTPLEGRLPEGYDKAMVLLLDGPRILVMGRNGIGYEYPLPAVLSSPMASAAGRLRHDLDRDCGTYVNEPGIADELIVARSRRLQLRSFATTDTAGRFWLPLMGGVGDTVEISHQPSSPHQALFMHSLCQPVHRVGLTGTAADTLSGLELASRIDRCPLLTVSVTAPLRRPCMINRAAIIYQNEGNAPTSGQVELSLSYRPLAFSASYAYTALPGDSVFRFDLGVVAPGERGMIFYQDSLPCVATLVGQRQCHQVRLTQADSCSAPTGADHSMILITGRCHSSDSVEFLVRNAGGAMLRPRALRYYIDSALAWQGTYMLSSGQTQVLRLSNQLRSWSWHRLEADADSADPRRGMSVGKVYCGLGNPTSSDVLQAPSAASFDEACTRVTGSYDPNDKLVSPAGFGPGGQVPPGTRLTYTIRFQNTGTDTAFVVTIRDTLPEGLDIHSLRWGAVSHPGVRRSISGLGRPVLTWSWNRIMLPDSARSGPRSEGFVSFSISPERGLPLGTRIDNKAHIYFDFNEAVITPPVATTFDVVRISGVTAVERTVPTPGKRALALEPNPAHDQVLVRAPAAGTLTLLDAQGRVVRAPRRVASASAETLSLTGLPSGVYVVRLVSEGRGVWVERLVVR